MEILDIYDSNRMPTGRTFVRGTKPEGGYYLVAQVIVFNTKGQMLIQQRQAHIKVCVDKVDDGGILAEACQPECCIRQWPNLP